MQEKRNLFIDFIKGISMTLVVIGHVIQFVNKSSFYNSKSFIFIYSFHMPFFLAISGYLFFRTLKSKDQITILKQKFKQLIIPTLIWTILIKIVLDFNSNNSYIELSTILTTYLSLIPRFYWYLSVLFFSSILFSIFIKNSFKWYVQIILFLMLLLIPDFSSYKYFKYLFPFFVFGYYMNNIIIRKKNMLIFIISTSTILYFYLLYNWGTEYFIYTTGMNVIKKNDYNLVLDFTQLLYVSYRYLIGFSGIISVSYLLKIIYNKFPNSLIALKLESIGSKSMGIYLIHLLLLNLSLIKIIITDSKLNENILIILISSLLILTSYYLTKTIEKIRFLNKYFLGGK